MPAVSQCGSDVRRYRALAVRAAYMNDAERTVRITDIGQHAPGAAEAPAYASRQPRKELGDQSIVCET
jgi:hypothetical protein